MGTSDPAVLAAPIPLDDARRVAALRALRVAGTLPEERFDRITRLACQVFSVPIARIHLIDQQRLWVKSHHGLALTEMVRDSSFCGHAILHDAPLVVHDCLLDMRFSDSPLVVGQTQLRFYAGQPLHAADGARVGTLCIFDRQPRSLSDSELVALADLASLVDHELCSQVQDLADELTGLTNGRGFIVVAEHVLAMCRRLGQPASVVAVDLDGHDGDDASLRAFSQLLYQHFRASDIVARLGNDEFAVLCSGASTSHVVQSLKRLRDEFARAPLAEKNPNLSWNAGTAEFHPALDADIHALLRVAGARKHTARATARFAHDLEDL